VETHHTTATQENPLLFRTGSKEVVLPNGITSRILEMPRKSEFDGWADLQLGCSPSSAVPCGHTSYSWFYNGASPSPSHTKYSWCGGSSMVSLSKVRQLACLFFGEG
jgi:hypothetical protein